ncbi:MAG: nucleotide sugar dehydrogenase [Anaerolineae bacterium]
MNISVFGLGYVGTVSAVCFASYGHKVVGIDVQEDKVNAINNRQPPVLEPGIQELINKTIDNGNLSATTDIAAAVKHCEVALICVGTPSNSNGSFKMDYVQRVCEQIGEVIKDIDDYKVIAIRSTLLPGAINDVLIPALEKYSGKKQGVDFGIVVNPEFLREGTAIKDFNEPPHTIIGAFDERSSNLVAKIYESIDAPLYHTQPDTASMVKYASNAYHALKITFANEIARLSDPFDIDAAEVMDIFCRDTKLNVSARYLKPGFAFGGSCLPKDLRAMVHIARYNDIEIPMLNALLPSNQHQIDLAYNEIANSGKKNVTIVGLTFKPNTDDLRESPMLHLTETLIGKGFDVKIYDENLDLDRLVGANKAYIEKVIPHVAALMCADIDEALAFGDVVVTAHSLGQITGKLREDQQLINLGHETHEASENMNVNTVTL